MSCATPLAMNSGEIVEFRNSSCSLCHAQFKFCMQWCKLMADFKAFSECTKKDNNSANPSNTSFQHVPSSYGFFPHQSSYGVGPSHMFDTTTMTPPSAYYPRSSSSMSFYPPPKPSQSPQILQNVQSYQDEDDDDDEPQQQQPPRRPNKPRRRPTCGTEGHKWLFYYFQVTKLLYFIF